MKKAIGIIGYGNMGSAIGEWLKLRYQIVVFDKDKNKTKNLKDLKVANNITELIKQAEAVILAVKPQDFDSILQETKDYVDNKLIISIAAGIKTSYIEKVLKKARVIRVMPNLPAKVGEGMICLCKGQYAKQSDLDFAEQLFKNLGKTMVLKENMMDESTAISGSGPGYLYDIAKGKTLQEIKGFAPSFATTLTASAVSIGFSREQGKILAEMTTGGSIIYLEKEKIPPTKAKKQVASKRGTTEAGLKVLKHKVDNLTKAVQAALKRAKQLSKT